MPVSRGAALPDPTATRARSRSGISSVSKSAGASFRGPTRAIWSRASPSMTSGGFDAPYHDAGSGGGTSAHARRRGPPPRPGTDAPLPGPRAGERVQHAALLRRRTQPLERPSRWFDAVLPGTQGRHHPELAGVPMGSIPRRCAGIPRGARRGAAPRVTHLHISAS